MPLKRCRLFGPRSQLQSHNNFPTFAAMSTTVHTAWLHTGSNMGDRAENLRAALAHIGQSAGRVLQSSSVYQTQAWGLTEQPDFLNQVVQIATTLSPQTLLEAALLIEKSMGRERREKWGSRVIDIDILFYDDAVLHEENLHIPHPQLHLRNFVLAPLCEIAPDLVHPELNKNIRQLLLESPDSLTTETYTPARPRPLPYPFIVVEGNIGAGKTTLCQMLARDYGSRLILEQFAENPFLPYFYNNPERYAFPVELFFMTERHKQLQEELQQQSLFEASIIADYFFLKTLLFAKNNLPEEEYRLFQRLFSVLNAAFPKPDLLVFLHRPVESLMHNIKKRGRSYEQDISPDYLRQIQQVYFDFFKSEPPFPIIIIDVENADFQSNHHHYQQILDIIHQEKPTGIVRRTVSL